eukprot:CAMPEP_0194505528 /NCGR_PEP_ID=MMETSP0253-20130528/32410_1 /TAXON_ID=2966 /ORGANISM="Noctiluca scintillans" /LENGTH=87 /DNA_ID=CAMNT_0039348095 /DNA_START=13 /DNA_END=273 /DNA_ORIENTATION=-
MTLAKDVPHFVMCNQKRALVLANPGNVTRRLTSSPPGASGSCGASRIPKGVCTREAKPPNPVSSSAASRSASKPCGGQSRSMTFVDR